MFYDLSIHELEHLELVAVGYNNAENRLFISEKTTKNYASNIPGKLHLANRTQAVYARCQGVIRRD